MNTSAAKSLESNSNVIIAGGSGLIGKALSSRLCELGYQPVILSRRPRRIQEGVEFEQWDGKSLGPWAQKLENATAIVNLTGKSIDCRPTQKNFDLCLQSRLSSVKVIGEAVRHCESPPNVWIQASAVGIYGNAGDSICNETTPPSPTKLMNLCREWEKSFFDQDLVKTRKVALRIGVVFTKEGGALGRLARITKNFLGGRVGSGKQFVSWIDIRDLVDLFVFSIKNNQIHGVYNATSPNPVPNHVLMAALRKALKRPWCPPAPTLAVKLGAMIMSTNPALALESQRCDSRKIIESGFRFRYENLEDSLGDLL